MKVSLANLSKLTDRSKEAVRDVVKSSLIRLGTATEVSSPFNTSRFKTNWMSAFGSADTSTTESTAADAVGRLEIKLGTLKIGEIFYFTNSLPYAQALEYGHSEQAKSGMVRLNARLWPQIVDDEIRKRNRRND